ncbi:hypothetical protein JHK82_023369 [Glycine max]|nr:hypothetical protein JHK85_023905 [Glycine max]KAG5138638.1 hypothetical protein JHK82_023369 [Glycine max]
MNAVVRTRTIYIESSKQGNDDSKKAATTNEVSCKYSSLYSKSSATKNKSNLKLNSKSTHGIVENQPHLPRCCYVRHKALHETPAILEGRVKQPLSASNSTVLNIPKASNQYISKNQKRKIQMMSGAKGEELPKSLLRKETTDKGKNVEESKEVKDSEKELVKLVTKGTENLNIKESKGKSGAKPKMCVCAPTTHEDSFKCRLHRKESATHKSK